MAMNLEAVLRISANVVGMEELTDLERKLSGAEKIATSARTSFSAVVNSATWQAAAAAAAGIGVALGASVRAAVEFESAMSDVRKVVPGLESAEGFRQMKQEVIGLSRELPVSAEGLAAIMAAAGQAGIPREELAQFTRQAAQMGVAFDMTAEEAGEAMAKLRTSLNISQPEVVSLGDAMNHLSNNMASSASEVVEFMLRAGAFGKQVKMTTEQTAALGSAMIAAGAAPEVAATSFRNLIKALAAGDSATARQSAAFKTLGLDVIEVAKNMQTDAVGTMRDVFLRIQKLPAEMRISVIKEVFGDEARALTPLITNMKLFDQAMGLVGDSSKYAGSMLKEFESRAGTSANNFQIFQNNIKALQIALGEGLLPAINLVLKILSPLISIVAQLAGQFPLLTAVIVTFTAALAALIIAAPAIVAFISILGSLKVALGISSLAVGWAGLQTVVIVAVSSMTAALAGFITWIGATLVPGLLALFSGPVGWTILAVAAVVAMAIAFREPLMQFVTWLGGLLGRALQVIEKWASGIPQLVSNAWNASKTVVTEFFAWFGNAVADGLKALWEWAQPIQEFWTKTWNSVKGVVGDFFAWFARAITSGLQSLWEWGEPIRTFWQGVWKGVETFVTAYFQFVRGVFDWGLKAAWAIVDTLFIRPWINTWENLIRKPVTEAQNWLSASVFKPLSQAFMEQAVIPIQGAWTGMTAIVRDATDRLLGAVGAIWSRLSQQFVQYAVNPIRETWASITAFLDAAVGTAVKSVSGAWSDLGRMFTSGVVTPVRNAWQGLMTLLPQLMAKAGNLISDMWKGLKNGFTTYVADPILSVWKAVTEALPNAMRSAASAIGTFWNGMISTIKEAVRGMLQYLANGVNYVAGLVNRLIGAFNVLAKATGGRTMDYIPTVNVPEFAKGGVVSRPTLALVGEGGEREYVIPESKMAAASSRFMGGARGSAVIPSSSTSAPTASATQINITTGPVLQTEDGQKYVTMEDFERGLRQVSNATLSRLRSPQARIALGLT